MCGFSGLDCASVCPEVVPQGVGRVDGLTVFVGCEVELFTQRDAESNLFRLVMFDRLDAERQFNHFAPTVGTEEQHPVIVADDMILSGHCNAVESSGEHRRADGRNALRPSREGAETMYWQADAAQLSGVPVVSPDDDGAESGHFGFEGDEVTDARFVKATAVINDQNFSSVRVVNDFEEDIDTAEMGDRECRAREPIPGHDWCESGRCGAYRESQSNTGIRDGRRRELTHHAHLRNVALLLRR